MSKLKLLALVSVIGLLAGGVLLAEEMQRVYQQQQDFDGSLTAHGIEPYLLPTAYAR